MLECRKHSLEHFSFESSQLLLIANGDPLVENRKNQIYSCCKWLRILGIDRRAANWIRRFNVASCCSDL